MNSYIFCTAAVCSRLIFQSAFLSASLTWQSGSDRHSCLVAVATTTSNWQQCYVWFLTVDVSQRPQCFPFLCLAEMYGSSCFTLFKLPTEKVVCFIYAQCDDVFEFDFSFSPNKTFVKLFELSPPELGPY